MSHKINGSLLVLGQLLNLKPEALSADPLVGSLGNEPRIWANTTDGILKFFNGTEITDLGGVDTVTTSELTTALVSYAKTADVTSAIATAVADLASEQEVTDAVANLVSTTTMNNAIDNALAGLDFQADVIGLETDFAGVAGRYIMVDGLSGITAVASNTNDIVTVGADGVETSLAYDVSVQGPGALVWNTKTSAWLRWDGATWAEFGGLVGVTAGNGISKTGDTVSIKLDGVTLSVGVNGLKVGDLSSTYVTPAALDTAVAGFQDAGEVGAAITAATANFQTAAQVGTIADTKIATALTPYKNATDTTAEIATAVSGLATTGSVTNAIQNALAGLDFQADVLGFDTDFAGVAGRYIFQTGAGWSNTAAGAAGDIVDVSAGGMMTALDYDVSVKGPGALVWNRKTSTWLRWDGATWAEFGGLTGVTAGLGLDKTGEEISVKLDGTSLVVGANGLKVGDLSAIYAPASSVADVADSVSALTARIEASYFEFDPVSAGTTITVTHNFGNKYPQVQVVDTDDTLIGVEEIKFVDANTLTITLAVAGQPKVIVQGLKAIA